MKIWKKATLKDLVDLQRGYDLPSQNRIPGNIPVMGGGGLAGYHAESNVRGPGVIIGRSGAGFGTAFYCESDYWAHNTGLFVSNFKGNHPKYVFHFLDRFDFSRYNSGGAQPSLNRNFIYPIEIEIPPYSEQKSIAQLLDTWDQAVEKTERLIKARKKRFSWLGQALVNNQKDKPGMHNVILGDVCKPVTRKNNIGETNILTSLAQHGLISQLDYYSKSVSGADLSGYYLLKKGEFAYNRSSASGYPYGAIKRLDYCDQGAFSTLYICFKISDREKIYSDFLCHYFESGCLNRPLREICQAGARSHGLLNVSKGEFFNLKLFLPPIDQQKKLLPSSTPLARK